MADGTEDYEVSIALPRSLDTRIYIRLSTQTKALMLNLTTATQDDVSSAPPMGSFVYALPDRFNERQPLATELFPHEPTVEFTTRIAKLLARKFQLPIYVSNSVSFANAGMGGTVEEEMEAFKNIVDVVVPRIQNAGIGPPTMNGIPA